MRNSEMEREREKKEVIGDIKKNGEKKKEKVFIYVC
jgi:hypothetical protein